jgi:hypothetical protein
LSDPTNQGVGSSNLSGRANGHMVPRDDRPVLMRSGFSQADASLTFYLAPVTAPFANDRDHTWTDCSCADRTFHFVALIFILFRDRGSETSPVSFSVLVVHSWICIDDLDSNWFVAWWFGAVCPLLFNIYIRDRSWNVLRSAREGLGVIQLRWGPSVTHSRLR